MKKKICIYPPAFKKDISLSKSEYRKKEESVKFFRNKSK